MRAARPFLQGCCALRTTTHPGLPTTAMHTTADRFRRRRGVEGSTNSPSAGAVVLPRRSPFVGPTNVGVMLFKHPQGGHTGLHISATALAGVMNQGNYFTLMSAIQGGFPPVPSMPAGPGQRPPRRSEVGYLEVGCHVAESPKVIRESLCSLPLCASSCTWVRQGCPCRVRISLPHWGSCGLPHSRASVHRNACQCAYQHRLSRLSISLQQPAGEVMQAHAMQCISGSYEGRWASRWAHVHILACAGHMKEESSFRGGRKPPEPQAPQRTRMNSALKFGPPEGDAPSLQLSIAVPELRVGAPAAGLTGGGCSSLPCRALNAGVRGQRTPAWEREAAKEVWCVPEWVDVHRSFDACHRLLVLARAGWRGQLLRKHVSPPADRCCCLLGGQCVLEADPRSWDSPPQALTAEDTVIGPVPQVISRVAEPFNGRFSSANTFGGCEQRFLMLPVQQECTCLLCVENDYETFGTSRNSLCMQLK